jgi:hypothetical protein
MKKLLKVGLILGQVGLLNIVWGTFTNGPHKGVQAPQNIVWGT